LRLRRLDIAGFRAFSGSYSFDLDADAVLVWGPNGQGKTSLLDAVLWGLAGKIPRLKEGSVISLFSSAGEARVEVELALSNGESATVTRSTDLDTERDKRSKKSAESALTVSIGDEVLRGAEARARLLRLLWPAAASSMEDPSEALAAAFQSAIYLQQDRVRDFIDARDDRERFVTVSELLGVGRIEELQVALDTSRRNWTQTCNVREEQLNRLTLRLDENRALLGQLETVADPIDSREWDAWWAGVEGLRIGVEAVTRASAPNAASGIDGAMNALRARSAARQQSRAEVSNLIAELKGSDEEPNVDLAPLLANVQRVNDLLGRAKGELLTAQTRASEVRRLKVQAREAQEQLRALAELALQHLGDKCPVCGQDYNHDQTEHRLRDLASGGATSSETGGRDEVELDVNRAALAVEQLENEFGTASNALTEAQLRLSQWSTKQAAFEERVRALGMSGKTREEWLKELETWASVHDAEFTKVTQLLRDGETLALGLARTSQLARRAELERDVAALSATVAEQRADLESRHATGEVAVSVMRALQAASESAVQEQLERLEPLLQRIYSAADPHPAFRVMRLFAQMRSNRGRLASSVEDPVRSIASSNPEVVLSSSQMNVAAVSVFLALNLGMPGVPLNTIMFDDPLQSLDDLNLLGLIDVLRRVRPHRQLILTTHDERFSNLLERKLRPIHSNERTVVLDLEGWSPQGPTITTREIGREVRPIRLVA
jgi:DNA repair exonuclease SbcCD ATPase subunit